MRIAQLVSNFHPVRETFNKAIGSHVAWLTNGLVSRGHDVHLFASSDSTTKATLHANTISLYGQNLPEEVLKYYMLLNISKCYEYAQKHCDIVHSHYNLLSSFLSHASTVPTVISLHSPVTERIRPLLMHFKNERYISFTLAQRKQMPELNWYANIYHGVDTKHFSFNEAPEDYFLYLGRITEDKGVHLAIEAAKKAGVKLRIAGVSYPGEGYWQRFVEPHIDGETIRFFGEATYQSKVSLYRGAKALLFPTQVAEVFGYVMIEAMSCGTPIIGYNKGSVSEIVKDGQTGYVVSSVDEMVDAIKKIDSIDRKKVRQRAETYFSVEKMVKGYERVYKRVLEEVHFKKNKN